MEFEIKSENENFRFIIYNGEDGENSIGHVCSKSDLNYLLTEASAALSNDQPIINQGMFALIVGQNRIKPYRLIVYDDHSIGIRISKFDINKLKAILEEFFHG